MALPSLQHFPAFLWGHFCVPENLCTRSISVYTPIFAGLKFSLFRLLLLKHVFAGCRILGRQFFLAPFLIIFNRLSPNPVTFITPFDVVCKSCCWVPEANASCFSLGCFRKFSCYLSLSDYGHLAWNLVWYFSLTIFADSQPAPLHIPSLLHFLPLLILVLWLNICVTFLLYFICLGFFFPGRILRLFYSLNIL